MEIRVIETNDYYNIHKLQGELVTIIVILKSNADKKRYTDKMNEI